MSEMVHYKGTLKKVLKNKNETLEELCKRILNANGVSELDSWSSSWEEQLNDSLYKMAVIYEGNVYMVDKEAVEPDSDIYNANKNADGTIKFEVMYYDGGCSFNEAIEEALSRMESEEPNG